MQILKEQMGTYPLKVSNMVILNTGGATKATD